ncbi:MAG: tRNA lysidine(34) synthetase TilS [Bacteroidales bacterium]|nr:tRNA lysidine(34) synthetase TilS [Bacteroidales bacterium]
MEKNVFIEKVAKFIESHHILSPNEAYLVAVSGGADSVVLLRVMLELGYRCTVAHCNFHLRGEESVRDEHFVTALCRDLGVECIVTHFDVPAYEHEHGVSTEMACRELRYAWFRELMREHSLDAVVVAHHSDDNVETLFLNLMRGSGIAGLTAMRPVSGDVRRPLLGVSRGEIEAFAAEIGQTWVTDSTNLESIVKRNRLRNIVIPELLRQFPDAQSGILRTIGNVQQCNSLYRQYIDELKQACCSTDGDIVRVNLATLGDRVGTNIHTALFEIIRQYGFNSAQVNEMLAASTGCRFISGSHIGVINRDFLDISPSTGDEEIPSIEQVMNVEIRDAAGFLPRSLNGKTAVCFDASILNAKLELRHWRKGDRFRPFGMKGSRLVSDIFSDLKLSEPQKRRVLLLTADGDIVWILGIRSGALYSMTASTKRILVLTLRSMEF